MLILEIFGYYKEEVVFYKVIFAKMMHLNFEMCLLFLDLR